MMPLAYCLVDPLFAIAKYIFTMIYYVYPNRHTGRFEMWCCAGSCRGVNAGSVQAGQASVRARCKMEKIGDLKVAISFILHWSIERSILNQL